MKEYEDDILSTSARHVVDVIVINKALTEKTLRMRCLSYNAQVKSQLLTQTIFEIATSKKFMQKMNLNLKEYNLRLEQKQKIIVKQKEKLQKRNLQLVQARNKEEERTKELTQANIQLKELDSLKSIFIASMSHELRTPLNCIIGFTGIILQGMVGKITDEQRKQLTMVKNSGSYLLSLINDIIDVSKIEAGKVDIYVQKFDLLSIVKEVINSFTVLAKEKDLKMDLEMSKKIMVENDERRIKQILVNIVGNAVKFTDKGSVNMCVRELSDSTIEIIVADTGIGIKEEDMGKLFKTFSRIPTEGVIKEGTGLGLYLCKKISDLIGGKIMAESEFGKGSTFTFTLPLRFTDYTERHGHTRTKNTD